MNYCRNYLRWKESVGTLKMMDRPTQSPDLNPIEQIWGELENNWTDLLHSKESLWLELQKAWDNISVDVLRKYTDNAREMCCCNCCKRWTYQIFMLKVDKNSTTHFIWYLLCSEQASACFLNIMKWNHVLEAKKVNIFRSVRCSNHFGHHCSSGLFFNAHRFFFIFLRNWYFYSALNLKVTENTFINTKKKKKKKKNVYIYIILIFFYQFPQK